MNRGETAIICRTIEAMFPAQRLDPTTPKVWADILEDIPFSVAMVALREIAKESAFVAVSDIRRVVKRMQTTTRRAVRQRARDLGVLVNVDAEADAAITSGLAAFDGIDLMKPEDRNYYAPERAALPSWQPASPLLELTT